MKSIRTLILLGIATFTLLSLAACTKPQHASAPLPEVQVGIAGFSQPQDTHQLLAGYIQDNVPAVDPKLLPQLDEVLVQTLRKKTKRPYTDWQTYQRCRNAKAPGEEKGRVAALRHWVAVGECMGVDHLLVPQVLYVHEREGGEAGVVSPARVVMDIFLIDIKNKSIARSHYDETQGALTENLLDTGKFIARGGKWVKAIELAREGMEKATKDLGL